MRGVLRVVSLAAILCLPFSIHGVTASADGPTWSGTWARTEVSGNLILTQMGNVVSGHYTWNDASGHVSGTVSGSTFDGAFTETHYRGSFALTLAGLKFTGSYTGINRDTGGDISGSFSGTCTAGDCLANASTPPSSVDAEKTLRAVLGGASTDELTAILKQRTANFTAVVGAGVQWPSAFERQFPSASPEASSVISSAAQIAAAKAADGTPVAPAVRALLPVIAKMLANGAGTGDPAAESDAITAAKRLLVLALGTDLGYQQLGYQSPAATPA